MIERQVAESAPKKPYERSRSQERRRSPERRSRSQSFSPFRGRSRTPSPRSSRDRSGRYGRRDYNNNNSYSSPQRRNSFGRRNYDSDNVSGGRSFRPRGRGQRSRGRGRNFSTRSNSRGYWQPQSQGQRSYYHGGSDPIPSVSYAPDFVPPPSVAFASFTTPDGTVYKPVQQSSQSHSSQAPQNL